MNIRVFEKSDVPALAKAIESDKLHPGEWKISHFYDEANNQLPANTVVSVIEDSKGPVSFVRYTKTLRISCVWADGDDAGRNARAVIQGLRDAVERARAAGFSEIIIQSSYPPLANFLTRVMGMTQHGDQFILTV